MSGIQVLPTYCFVKSTPIIGSLEVEKYHQHVWGGPLILLGPTKIWIWWQNIHSGSIGWRSSLVLGLLGSVGPLIAKAYFLVLTQWSSVSGGSSGLGRHRNTDTKAHWWPPRPHYGSPPSSTCPSSAYSSSSWSSTSPSYLVRSETTATIYG